MSPTGVYLGTTWKWVWMYEVGGRKLGYLLPMQSGVSGTFVFRDLKSRKSARPTDCRRVIKQAVVRDAARRRATLLDGVRRSDAVEAFVDVVRLKYQLLARPE